MIGWQNPPPQIDKVGLFVAEQVNESFASEKKIRIVFGLHSDRSFLGSAATPLFNGAFLLNEEL